MAGFSQKSLGPTAKLTTLTLALALTLILTLTLTLCVSLSLCLWQPSGKFRVSALSWGFAFRVFGAGYEDNLPLKFDPPKLNAGRSLEPSLSHARKS